MKVTPIGNDGVTPQSVLAIAQEGADELEGVIVIGFRKDKGTQLSCACTLSEMALAQIIVLEHLLEVRDGKTPAQSH